MKHSLVIFCVLLLAGCTIVPPRNSTQQEHRLLPPKQEEQAEGEASSMSTAGTGAVLHVGERLLPTGILEIGRADAPLVLLIWTNHSCSYCREFHSALMPLLMQDFIATGKIRLQITLLQLQKYSQSTLFASSLQCAAQNGKGLPMHTYLSENTSTNLVKILEHGAAIGIDAVSLQTCIDDDSTQFLLGQQKSLAASFDVTLVPTLFLQGQKSVGFPTYPDLRGKIEEALRSLQVAGGA